MTPMDVNPPNHLNQLLNGVLSPKNNHYYMPPEQTDESKLCQKAFGPKSRKSVYSYERSKYYKQKVSIPHKRMAELNFSPKSPVESLYSEKTPKTSIYQQKEAKEPKNFIFTQTHVLSANPASPANTLAVKLQPQILSGRKNKTPMPITVKTFGG